MHPSFLLAEGSLLEHSLLGPDMLLVFGVMAALILGVVLLVRLLARRGRADDTKPPVNPV